MGRHRAGGAGMNRPPRKQDLMARARVLEQGLLACYEIIDGIRKEQARVNAQLIELLKKEAPRHKP